MDFVGNQTWFAVLLITHVVGAIVGLGPTFAFPIMGPMAEKTGPRGGILLLEAIEKIERGIVLPVLLTVQLGTGIGLIFNRGLNNDFFGPQNAWLTAALGIYIAANFLVIAFDLPAMGRAIQLAHDGKAGTPEFLKEVSVPKRLGPVLAIMGLSIIVLMVWKPGSDCGPLMRC